MIIALPRATVLSCENAAVIKTENRDTSANRRSPSDFVAFGVDRKHQHRMADGTLQPELNISYREVKGFTGLGVCVLRFPYQVPDHARCKHCNCIPRRIYHLLCFRHGLCFHCRKDCDGYYCDECRIDITPEQLGALRSDYNLDGILLKVLCGVCDKELPLGELEEHLCKHTNQGRMEASKVQQTANQMSKQEEARNENAKLVKRIQELENRQLPLIRKNNLLCMW
ncbi:uncharacterized protein LOC120848883 isoform X2 [Ixodes scapularis]|uniref:uncharacterized protein LOC120848883 isoform X2 n=1 Tax=Ixodes scapularis TaxID=6945 RepID=UPI001C387C8A|nr:uncharacterized protein LOC120848883 isoform X2 [Ixodes scapularis]